jgi:flagellar motor switch protein FliN
MSDVSATVSNMPEDNADGDLQARVDAMLGRSAQSSQAGPPFRSDAPGEQGGLANRSNINMLMDVVMQLSVELGRTRMTIRQVLDLQHGSVVELDRLAGEAVDIFVNDHLLARGEVVVVDDKFGVRITDMVSPTAKNGDA